MPALRLSRRRKSSHILFTAAKPGIYGIAQRPVTFAPNVTPVSYVETDDAAADLAADPASSGSPTATLFPPSVTPAPPPARKRCPPGKRRSQGYIPRPPNAFMLFRADFVRQKHVPGSIETNHGSLSKIIGTCWRQLPLEEKRVWEVRARQEKAAHKAQFPDYRFRPVHNKNKQPNANATSTSDRREKPATTREDERRCEEVAALLLEGKKGEALAQAVRTLDRARERELEMEELGLEASRPPSSASSAGPAPHALHMPTPMPMLGMGMHAHLNMGMNPAYMRRPSSVPLPSDLYNYASGGIAMPALPFFQSRPQSPVASIARQGQQFGGAPYHGFTNPFQPEFSFASADPFSSHHQPHPHQQQQDVDPTFAFADPFALHQPFPSLASHNTFPSFSHTPSFSHAFGTGFGHPSLAQRASLGLGRRASSAQAMLMRSYTVPMYSDHQQPLARDESPLPDVEPALFAADFSFGGSGSSAGASSSAGAMMGDECVSPVDPVSAGSSVGGSSGSTAYDGSPSPIAVPQGLDLDLEAGYMHASAYPQEEMYAVSVGVGVEEGGMYAPHMPLEEAQMWGKGVEMGMGLEMEAFFEAGF